MVCSLKSGTGAFRLFFKSIFVFPALCCTQSISSAVMISHITSLAATGELLAAQTVLALRPLETSTTASDLMKRIEQNGGKLFAKNRLLASGSKLYLS